MGPAFKYLRVITALALFICVALEFLLNLQVQSNAGFDGPFAHYWSYTFAFNKFILAILLGVVLLFDFDIKGSRRVKKAIRYLCLICMALGLAGFVFLIRQHIFMGTAHMHFITLYLFQITFVLVAMTLYGKTRQTGDSDHA